MAIGCMTALQNHGLNIPGDLSIVGFDDIPFATSYARPRLTTIYKPNYEMGAVAAKLLLFVFGHVLAFDIDVNEPTMQEMATP